MGKALRTSLGSPGRRTQRRRAGCKTLNDRLGVLGEDGGRRGFIGGGKEEAVLNKVSLYRPLCS